MEPFLKSDIFFFITSIAVIIITILLTIICYRLIRILKDVEYITDTLKNTVHSARSGLVDIGERITESALFSFVFGKKSRKPKSENKKTMVV